MIGRLIAIVAIAFIATAAHAQQKGEQVTLLGCVSAGVERGCLMIKDRSGGKTYQINASRPRPSPAQRLVVLLTGTVTDKVDFCQQGPVLENITWAYTKMACDAESPSAQKATPRRRGKKSD